MCRIASLYYPPLQICQRKRMLGHKVSDLKIQHYAKYELHVFRSHPNYLKFHTTVTSLGWNYCAWIMQAAQNIGVHFRCSTKWIRCFSLTYNINLCHRWCRFRVFRWRGPKIIVNMLNILRGLEIRSNVTKVIKAYSWHSFLAGRKKETFIQFQGTCTNMILNWRPSSKCANSILPEPATATPATSTIQYQWYPQKSWCFYRQEHLNPVCKLCKNSLLLLDNLFA